VAHTLLVRRCVRVLCSLLLAACTTPDSHCADVAAALASCHGIDAEAFRTACEQAPPDEVAALITDDALAQSCPAADGGKADGLGEQAFLFACRPVLLAGYLVDRMRNPSSEPLDAASRATLRPYFGATVDAIRVHWNSLLVDDWPVLHIENAFMDVGAQTFGAQIFASDASSRDRMHTLAHELTHAKQAERLGGVGAFAGEYCRAFYRSGFSYDGNALEVEAYATAARIVP